MHKNRLQILIGLLFLEIFILVLILVGAHKFLYGRASVSASVNVVNETPVVTDLKVCATGHEECANLDHLILTAGTDTKFYAVGRVSDLNGFEDIADVQLRFYRSSLGNDCEQKPGSCQNASLSTKDCSLHVTSAVEGLFVCKLSLPYWSDPTWGERATYHDDSWVVRASVLDTARAGAWKESHHHVNALLSLQSDKEVILPNDSGSVPMMIRNTGNVKSDLLVSLDSLRCGQDEVSLSLLADIEPGYFSDLAQRSTAFKIKKEASVYQVMSLMPSADAKASSDYLYLSLDWQSVMSESCVANLTITAY